MQVVEVEAGKEPHGFTAFFPEWRLEKAQKWLEIGEKAEEAKQAEEVQKKAIQAAKTAPKVGAGAAGSGFKKAENLSQDEIKKQEEDRSKLYLDPSERKLSYAELNGQFPKGVDPTKKEAYLTEEEFATVFGMSSAAFTDLKQWKKNDLKKDKGLF